MKPIETEETFEDVFDGLAFRMLEIMYDRQRKYGPENINKAGMFGLVTRIEDKVERIKRGLNGRIVNGEVILEPAPLLPDEEPDDADFDLANYALIRIAKRRGLWGKPMREETGEVRALAGDGPIPQLQEDGSVTFTGFPDAVEEDALGRFEDEGGSIEHAMQRYNEGVATPEEIMEVEDLGVAGYADDQQASYAPLERTPMTEEYPAWPGRFIEQRDDRQDEERIAQQAEYLRSMGPDEIGPAHGEPV